jgi:hypothetical protein
LDYLDMCHNHFNLFCRVCFLIQIRDQLKYSKVEAGRCQSFYMYMRRDCLFRSLGSTRTAPLGFHASAGPDVVLKRKSRTEGQSVTSNPQTGLKLTQLLLWWLLRASHLKEYFVTWFAAAKHFGLWDDVDYRLITPIHNASNHISTGCFASYVRIVAVDVS